MPTIQVWCAADIQWQAPDDLDTGDYAWLADMMRLGGFERSPFWERVAAAGREIAATGISVSALSSTFDTNYIGQRERETN
jgi:hypothetical protein